MDYSKSFSLYLYILADMATKLAKNSPLAMCLLCFFDQQTNILSLFCVFSRFFWCFLVLLTSSFFLPHLSFICLRLFFSHCRVICWVSVIPAVVGSHSHCPAVSLFLPCLPLPSVFPCSSRVFLILPLSPNKLHPLIFLRVVLYVCFHLLHSHHERRFGIEGRVGRHPNVSVSDESLSNGLWLTEVGSHQHINSL